MRKQLYHARKDAGLTQAQVAKMIGIDRSTYNRIERGTRKDIPIHLALKIAEVLGKNVEDIFLPDNVHQIHNINDLSTGTEGN